MAVSVKAVHSTSGPKIFFPHLLSVKRVWHIYIKKQSIIFQFVIFALLRAKAELRLPIVIRKVKFNDFVKRAMSHKCSWQNFVFIQILRYIHYFDWQDMETFRKILNLPERLEDTLLGGLCSPTKIKSSLRARISKVGSKWRLKSRHSVNFLP